uniref:Mitochondrial intermediate peptidase n=1 Tax=Limonomyces culmigenus TaxID=228944 RepID=A0A0P0JT43_9AGAM|nr:mitochondrial intermediate peptidase 1 [Limonomyces culmigenus]
MLSALDALTTVARRSLRHPARLCSATTFHGRRRRISTANTVPVTGDDLELAAVFDQPSTSTRTSSFPSGLFGEAALATPQSLHALTDDTVRRARAITQRIKDAPKSREEMFKVVKNLDRLSDTLCAVIDLTELVRNAHPNATWVQAADDVYDKLCEYMNVLNVDVGLYEVLCQVLSDRDVAASLSEEALQTALIFIRDFEKHGIHLPEERRNHVVALTTNILSLGRQFLNDAGGPMPPALIKPSELEGMKNTGLNTRYQLQARFSNRDLQVYPGSLQAQMIMRSAPLEEPRRKVYQATNASSPERIELLEAMLRARAYLARVLGHDSFSRLTLADKMAKSPENVMSFLDALMDHTRPHARSALKTLSMRKQSHLNTSSLPVIQAWDRDYYCPPEAPAPPIPLPPLTLGTVFMGLSRLFKNLYGITFRPADVAPGEVWHSDVRKLEVVDEDAGVIGWVYADLFARRGKASGAAHYTVRCSRRVDDDDVVGDAAHGGHVMDQTLSEFGHASRRRVHGQAGLFQLPIVVVLCEFSRPSLTKGATTLDWHEVTTLFHEMGHVMHSMIGRTEFQNVSGTRCATDAVELPSVLMEHFLQSPQVLSLFSTSDTTEHRVGNHHEDPCRSIDTHSQILLAMLDQEYHSPSAQSDNFDSTAALAALQNHRGLIPHVDGTAWQTQFGHLFGYGATYYSYLFDRAIASRVWSKLFSANPLSRRTGEKYKTELLRYGGGKDPWKMVAALLDAPQLALGDAEAMKEVGRWRIEDEVSFGRH